LRKSIETAMKIWIDFINSPQVSFFEPLINELSNNGHEFILTCRDSSNTVALLKQRNWAYSIIGNKAQKSFGKKLLSFPLRVSSLYSHLKNKRPDVAICQSSFYLPVTAKMLGIPSIYTNDNEHAMGNIPSFLFATQIFVPENLSIAKILKKGAKRNKITQYPGIKEGVYLWIKGLEIRSRRENNSHSLQNIYVRPEPVTAQYYSGKLNFLDNVLIELKDKYPIIILVRDKSQLEHYTQPEFAGIKVPNTPLSFEEVAINCLLFIGAGGTMTREMAMMGVSTISVYDGELLDVDKFLISESLMVHQPNINRELIEEFLNTHRRCASDNKLMDKGKEAYDLFKLTLLTYMK